MVVADPRGDLPSARELRLPGARVLGRTALELATRERLSAALRSHPQLLVVAGHVRAGTSTEPASAALMLDTGDGGEDPFTVAELAEVSAPPWCLLLGCDGAGMVTGAEWTGLVTGLIWAGAHSVATSTVPVIDDDITHQLETELMLVIARLGPLEGLIAWQRTLASRYRSDENRTVNAPYRWATYVATRATSGRVGMPT